MATLREMYDTAFSLGMTVLTTVRSETEDAAVSVSTRIHLDVEANAKFLSCYLAEEASTNGVCRDLINRWEFLLAQDGGAQGAAIYQGEQGFGRLDSPFTGRLFIYHEAEIADVDDLQTVAAEHGISLRLRGPAFAAARAANERPMAFISHDSRDKDEIARPIAVGLSKLMCTVWFDEFSLTVGARLRESIERGLKEARKCVLVLTPNFLSNTGWTQVEFNAVFSRELVDSADGVIPVWHNVTSEDVFRYSPALVNRLGARWADGQDTVLRQLHRAIVV